MKNLLATLVLLLISYSLFSQERKNYFRQIYDQKGYDQFVISPDSSTVTDTFVKYRPSLYWGHVPTITSMLYMFEATNNLKYTNIFIKNIGNLIDRRDDLRNFKIYDFRDSLGPVWASFQFNDDKSRAYAHTVHAGNITFPMAKFATLIKQDPSIQNTVAPAGGRYGGMTYADIADDLIEKAHETLMYHNDQWFESGNQGWYEIRSDENSPVTDFRGYKVPMNYIGSIGRAFVHLYVASNDAQRKSIYLDRIYKLSNFLKANIDLNPETQSYEWKYWVDGPHREDVSYAGLTSNFPYECVKNDIKYNNASIYTEEDLRRYARTFTRDIVRGPLEIYKAVHTSEIQDIVYVNFKDGQNGIYGSLSFDATRLLPLSEYDDELYQIVADLFSSSLYNSKVINRDTRPLTLALLAKYVKILVPISSELRFGANSDWSGVACGNFDNDLTDEFISVRNADGTFFLQELSGKNQITINERGYGNQYAWAGIAAGNFFGDSKDEFVSLSNHSDGSKNGVHLFSVENNLITPHTVYPTSSSISDWVEVTAGNFISGGTDDVIAARNYRKQLVVYKFVGETMQLVNINDLDLPVDSEIQSIASGNLDGDDKSEIIVLVNSPENTSNGFYIYDVNDDGTLTLITRSTGWLTSADWRGLVVGDFNGNGTDEFIVQNNLEGSYRIYNLCGNTICPLGTEYFLKDQVRDNILSSGNLDASSENDELIALRNHDAVATIFSYSFPISASSIVSLSEIQSQENAGELTSSLKINEVSVFPNPTNGVINLQTDLDSEVTYTVYDLNGKEIKIGRFTNVESFDLSNRQKGVYFLKLIYEDQIEVHKLYVSN